MIYSKKDKADSMRKTISNVIRTILCGGFQLIKAESKPGFYTLICYRLDEFGAELKYCFIVTNDRLNKTQMEIALIEAKQYGAIPVIIGEADGDTVSIEWVKFANIFGGPVLSVSPMEKMFQDNLIELSFDKLPSGLVGDADDLFEQYVNSALIFLMGGPVKSYGQKRRFERKPDGIAIPNDNFCALYDAKAYSNGYEISISQVRQFSSYVEDFEKRYSNYNVPRLNSFLVISGKFQQRTSTLEKRSKSFLADNHIPLSFFTSIELVEMLKYVSEYPGTRKAIQWNHIFSDTIASSDRVKKEIQIIKADHIIKR
jgi:hypothetical protein